MKKLALFILALAGSAWAQTITPVVQNNDVEKLAERYYDDAVDLFAGDSVRWDVYAKRGRDALDLSAVTFPVLLVAAETNLSQVYVAATGTVVTATNGHVRITLSPDQTLLSTAITYSAYISAVSISGDSTNEIATLAYNQLTVKPSLYLTDYDFIAPASNAFSFTYTAAPGAITGDVVSIFVNDAGYVPTGTLTTTLGAYTLGSTLISTSAGLQASIDGVAADVATLEARTSAWDTVSARADSSTVWGVISGLATGSPLYGYTETDPVWTAASTGYLTKVDAAGTYATGTPLYAYAETDPVWVAASTGYLTKVGAGSLYVPNGGSFTGRWFAAGNTITGVAAFVGGGSANNAGGTLSAVGGGNLNSADSGGSVVGGGLLNKAGGQYSSIGGGLYNSLSGQFSALAGGVANTVTVLASYATIPGGIFNRAAAAHTFAAGSFASAVHKGAFVWGDSDTNTLKTSIGVDTFNVYADGGFYLLNSETNAYVMITATGGLKVGFNSFTADPQGNIAQDTNNTATLGLLNAVSINASGLTGAIPAAVVSASGVATGAPLYGYTETDGVWTAASTGYLTKVSAAATYATGTPVYVEADPAWSAASTGYLTIVSAAGTYATGTPVYAESDPVWTAASTGYLTIVSAAGTYATGTPVYAEADPAWIAASTNYLTTAAAASTYATGTPVYVESDPVWTAASTGYLTIVSASGTYATGTPVYAESDPVWSAASTGYLTIVSAAGTYATGTPVYAEADPVWTAASTGYLTKVSASGTYATGTPVYAESDPVWSAASTGYLTIVSASGTYATGTPVYAESDPVWSAASTGYLTKVSASGTYATGTPIYVESDPVWVAASTGYLTKVASAAIQTDNSNQFWNASNDGAGSGLDADLLDGNHAAAFVTLASFQAYTTNAMKLFNGTVTGGQASTYGSVFYNSTNLWFGLGGTNWLRISGQLQ